MLALLALTLIPAASLPNGWRTVGAVLKSKIVSRESVALPQDAVVDLSGKYVYSQDAGKRWEIATGKERRCTIEGDQDYEIPRRRADSFRIYFDRVHTGASVYTFAKILYAKDDLVVAHIAGGGASTPNYTPTVVVMKAGGLPVRTATQAQLARISDTPSIWASDLRPYRAPASHLNFYLYEDNWPKLDRFYRRIPASFAEKPDLTAQVPKGLKPLDLPRNGIDWEKKLAYAATMRVVSRPGPSRWIYEFAIEKPKVEVLRRIAEPIWRDVDNINFFGRLRDGTLARGFWSSESSSDLLPVGKGPEGYPLASYSTYLLDPEFKKWTLYKGLMICGSSTDGRYVAYATSPWKEMQVAEVTQG